MVRKRRVHFTYRDKPILFKVNEEDESHSEVEDIEQPRYTQMFYSPPLSPLLSRCETSSSSSGSCKSSSFVNGDQFEQLKKQMDELRALQAQQMQVQQSFNTSILIGIVRTLDRHI